MRYILWPICGLFFGLLMASFMLVKHMHDFLLASPLLVKAYDTLHLPAQGLLIAWRSLGLPPSGDAGFILYPCSVVGEWTLVGLLARSWWERRQDRQAVKLSGPEKSTPSTPPVK